MRHWTSFGMVFLALLCPAAHAQSAANLSLPHVLANDNRTPAGRVENGVLELQLELRAGIWYPEEEGGSHREVYAFAEEGHTPQSSGPLIRVPQGTQIHATIHNRLPLPAKIHGLHPHPGDAKDTIKLAPGEARELRFLAGEPGTYLYWATTSDSSLELREEDETLLSGAFVIDAPGAKQDDRVFVIGIWTKGPPGNPDEKSLSINGKSWPLTERLIYRIGQTTHWRVLNPTFSDHAMHLHGFFFTVDGAGDGERYERYSQEQRRRAVTEHVDAGHVFEMTWTPEREGNWLYHCHMLGHMSVQEDPKEAQSAAHMEAQALGAGMSGLVMGITVLPGRSSAPRLATASTAHKLQLAISENPDKIPLYRLEVNDPRIPTVPDKEKPPSLLGPPIFLTRGETTEIEIKNLTGAPTAIHWHGMELESYYDGVVGWTGAGQQTTPPVGPGSSFVARMTPPRAGTFIYHTHWHDPKQLTSGLYGPLIVLEPGQKYDSERDRIFVFSMGRYVPFGYVFLVNGHPQPDPIQLHAGIRYRLRFINITDEEADLRVRLTNKDVPVQWKVVAKDGVDLPLAQLKVSTAEIGISVGETYDVEYQADTPGVAELKIWQVSFPSSVTQPLKFVAPK
jgi:FtsP/CotA-like multicopper oxidase with cupredoxin domain